MTSWTHHHPPHDHPDFNAYLDTLTEEDLTAMNAANDTASQASTGEPDTDNDF